MVYTRLALSVIALIFESLREAGGGVNFSGSRRCVVTHVT